MGTTETPTKSTSTKETKENLKVVRKVNKNALLFVTLLSALTRTYVLHHPHQVVFDEVHFGKFASYYLRGEYYFDVHPPLGKLLLALVGYVVGYDGHFLFNNIGDDYYANNVPFITFRLFCALVGALIVPVSYMVLHEVGCSTISCILGSLLLVFDTALIAQSRLILLDSMLLLFCSLALWLWIRYYTIRHEAFTLEWYKRLFMVGVGLALCTGIKMVGLFTVACVGLGTIYELWELLDYQKTTMRKFANHFLVRACCLILVPLVFYLVPFYIHFKVLKMSGPGDAFMSLNFQQTLQGNTRTSGSVNVMYGSNITIQHLGTSVYLHSHVHRYPLRHEDGRVSSQGQQVNGYAHSDSNSVWEIMKVDPTYHPHTPFEKSKKEKERDLEYIKSGSLVRLRHVATDSYLVTHDVASPLTTTNMEMTTLKYEATIPRYNDSVWRIQVIDADEPKVLKSKTDTIRIVSVKHNVAVHTHKKPLPEWGFKMQEINGNKKVKEGTNHWAVISVAHERIVDGTEVGEEKKLASGSMPFWKKFVELQIKMIHHNNQLTKSHPYSSAPISWPFVIRGISFWEQKDGLKQIYLLGNPIGWWISILGPLLYSTMWILDRILLKRGIDDFGPAIRRWWDTSLGFLFFCWVMHYIPFFLMGRMLFLHHYLPAYIFSTWLTTALLDFLGRNFVQTTLHHRKTRMIVWRRHGGSIVYACVVAALCLGVVLSFWYFMPLCYGLGFPDLQTLRAHKWLPTWDLQYA